MSLDQRVLAVIQALYDAAMDETLWPKALQEMTDLTGSQAATFWVLDSSAQPRLPTLITHNFDPSFMKAYLDGVVPHDPTVQYLVRNPEQLPLFTTDWSSLSAKRTGTHTMTGMGATATRAFAW